MNLNKVHLMGRLGNDPVIRITQKGTKVATFSLATQDFVKTKNENETTWHRIVAWGQSADFSSRFLKKGDAVYVDGSMKVRKFEGDDGKMNYMHEIHTHQLKKLGYKKESIELDEQHHQS